MNLQIARMIKDLREYEQIIYLGRGPGYAIALEGALKLKELCYIHAEGYAAGELKHGPIALIDNKRAVVVFVNAQTAEKMAANVQEVLARGGKCFVIISKSVEATVKFPVSDQLELIEMPADSEPEEVFYSTVILQLLAYESATARGLDVDQPRNLAKCVTVE